MTPRLTRRTLASVAPGLLPRTDPAAHSTGIVHLGAGAFHRAHQAVYTEAAANETGSADWGICGVSQRNPLVREALEAQDHLYAVMQRHTGGADLQVVGSVCEVLVASEDPVAVVDRLGSPQTRVVSLTVTEKGYHADLATGGLRRDAEIEADVAGRPPHTAVGQLVRGFEQRRQQDAGPVTVVPCDNVPANGRTLQRLVEDYCELLPAAGSGGLAAWITENVSFVSTMVDRIVPASDDRALREVQERLGLRDEAALVTEPFTQWVVEDRFAAGRPAWDLVGVTMTDDVTPFELMKLRLVNASNSSLAYLGLLAGLPHISDAVAVDEFAGFADRLIRDEMVPTIQTPPGVDVEAYCSQVIERFRNPWLLHRTRQVAMDGSQKLPQRVVRPIAEHRAARREPVLSVLTLAVWMEYVRRTVTVPGQEPLQDPMATGLREVVLAAGDSAERLVCGFLGLRQVFPVELAADPWLRDTLVRLVTELAADDPRGCVRNLVGA